MNEFSCPKALSGYGGIAHNPQSDRDGLTSRIETVFRDSQPIRFILVIGDCPKLIKWFGFNSNVVDEDMQNIRTQLTWGDLMILRKVLRIVCLFAPMWPAASALSQDLGKTVLPITPFHFKPKAKPELWPNFKPRIGVGLEIDYGTGFCVDQDCRLIGTNYHVAVIARPRKIKGEEVIHRYLATGPDDEGATLNDIPSERPLKYTLIRDIAIFELRHPLRHYHGIPFTLNDPEIGQQVDIYAYPKDSGNPIRLNRKLLRFHAQYKGQTTSGLLAFEYEPSFSGKEIRGGASGGLVVDSESQRVVGVLSRAGIGKSGERAALAVPIQSLADFVAKVQP